MPRTHCSRRLIVQTLVFCLSYLHRQVSPPETLVVKRGTTWARDGRWILPENVRLPRNIQGSFTCRKSTTWDRSLYFPFEGRRAEEFFALKNPTASVGFEPANFGTKGQHATSRPPKPLFRGIYGVKWVKNSLMAARILALVLQWFPSTSSSVFPHRQKRCLHLIQLTVASRLFVPPNSHYQELVNGMTACHCHWHLCTIFSQQWENTTLYVGSARLCHVFIDTGCYEFI